MARRRTKDAPGHTVTALCRKEGAVDLLIAKAIQVMFALINEGQTGRIGCSGAWLRKPGTPGTGCTSTEGKITSFVGSPDGISGTFRVAYACDEEGVGTCDRMVTNAFD